MTSFWVSVVTMNHINIERDVSLVQALGVDGLHIDVMDGHFVPRYGIYPEIVERIADVSNLPLDVHLMVDDIFFSLEQFSGKGKIESVGFHIEACLGHEMRAIDSIRGIGAKPIACLNLGTSFSSIERLIINNEIDGIMLMGIHPGVLQQEARPENILNDLSLLKVMLEDTSISDHIALDGAVSFDSMSRMAGSGITNFVGGSSTIFNNAPANMPFDQRKPKIEENWRTIQQILREC